MDTYPGFGLRGLGRMSVSGASEALWTTIIPCDSRRLSFFYLIFLQALAQPYLKTSTYSLAFFIQALLYTYPNIRFPNFCCTSPGDFIKTFGITTTVCSFVNITFDELIFVIYILALVTIYIPQVKIMFTLGQVV